MKALNHTGFDQTLEHEKKAIHQGKHSLKYRMIPYDREKVKAVTQKVGLYKYKQHKSCANIIN